MYNIVMNYEQILNETIKDFELKKYSLNKDDIKDLLGRSTLKGRLLGIFSPSYYKEEKLLKNGFIAYGLTIKNWRRTYNENEPLATWVLFSPQKEIERNPDILLKINQNIQDLILQDKRNSKYKKFINLVTQELAEPKYLLVPKELSEGITAFISFAYLKPEQIREFRLGMNLIIFNKSISNEIIYLPESCFTKKYYEMYYNIK